MLRMAERAEFDRMLRAARERAAACGMVPSSDVFEPAVLAMLVDVNSRLTALETRGDEDD
ncbi:MAG: hypothetical protein CXX69_06440 [Candidatus Thalassarchaeum betae]|uniref:DUF8156 domain-containing protein n=2 Tax=Candidatus Thalassarchaeum betae TaxID=2599289 RepID=A0A2V3HP15_9ARCH|nr:MAG: hypothetical protein CXX69_06440 [Candidatus Thalassoarchaea betae]PXF25211.1 MAG: hypothetical protein CXX70_08130 [Euryarchaeota archaeon]